MRYAIILSAIIFTGTVETAQAAASIDHMTTKDLPRVAAIATRHAQSETEIRQLELLAKSKAEAAEQLFRKLHNEESAPTAKRIGEIP